MSQFISCSLSGVSQVQAEQLFNFGKHFGIAFQVVDDILNLTSSTETLSKPVGSDLKKGNLTAPVLFALKEYPQLRGLIERKFSEVDDIARQWFVGILSGLIVIDVMLVITSVLCFPDRLGNSIFVLLIFPIILSGLGIGLTGIILGMNIGLKVGYFAGAAILLIFAVFGIGGNDLIRGLATILIFIILCLLN